MLGLEQVLIGVASGLITNGLSASAKRAWQGLKDVMRAGGDHRLKGAVHSFEENPGLETARNLASAASNAGLDQDSKMSQAVNLLGTQLAIGTGAVAGFTGINFGNVGGVHQTVLGPRLVLNAVGRHRFSMRNDGDQATSIIRLDCVGAESLLALVALPTVLEIGASLGIVISPRMGAGDLQLLVYEFNKQHPTRLSVPRVNHD